MCSQGNDNNDFDSGLSLCTSLSDDDIICTYNQNKYENDFCIVKDANGFCIDTDYNDSCISSEYVDHVEGYSIDVSCDVQEDKKKTYKLISCPEDTPPGTSSSITCNANCNNNVHENLNCRDSTTRPTDQSPASNNVVNQSTNIRTVNENANNNEMNKSRISFLHWNIQGMFGKLNDNDFVDYIGSFDFISLVETFTINFQTTLFNDYAIFTKSAVKFTRQGRPSGGLICMIRKRFLPYVKQIHCPCQSHLYFLIDKCIFGFEKDVLFVNLYVHPENSPFYAHFNVEDGIDYIEDCIFDKIVSFDAEVHLFLCGDFNARTSNVIPSHLDIENLHHFKDNTHTNSLIRNSQDSILNLYGKKLLSFCSAFGVCMLNGICNSDQIGRYTYIRDTGNSVNDYVLISREIYDFFIQFSEFSVSDRIESDHFPLSVIVNFQTQPRTENNTEEYPRIEKYIWNEQYEQQFYGNMNSENAKLFFNNLMNILDNNINEAIDMFTKFVKDQAECMRKLIVCGKKKQNEWFDRECFEERRKLRKFLRILRKDHNEENRHNYCKARREYKNLLNRKRKEYNDKIFSDLLGSVNNQKSFWQNMKKVAGRKMQPKHNITTETWYDHFKSVLEKDDSNEESQINIVQNANLNNDLMNELNAEITTQEIISVIRKLKSGKAAGPNGIISELFKNAGDSILPFLVRLFNKLFDSGTYPSQWNESIILPLFKKGEINNPNNYRGISLCDICSKLYSSIINNRLQIWVGQNNITGEHQAGYKKNYMTIDHAFTLLAAVQKQFSNTSGRKLYVAFVDFEKAFDSISRKLLWPILSKNGITGKLYNCIKSMYSDVKARIRNGDKLSNTVNSTKGVKQGDSCSSILFSLFVNELANDIINNGRHGVRISRDLVELFILLFADDLVLLSETVVGLQRQLNNLYTSSRKLDLKVNMSKTNIIVFRKGGYLAEREQWYFGRERVTVVNAYKYLGLYFSTRLSFTYTCNDLMSKAKNAIYMILRNMYRFQNSSIDVFFRLFDAQVQPILLYGAEIWGLEKGKDIEKVHLIAMKKLLFVPVQTPNDIIYGELGRYPLYINAYLACIKYWLRILLSMDANRIPVHCYKMLYALDERDKNNWVTNIRKCLCFHGFQHVWDAQGVGCTKSFLQEFKQRLIDCRWQEWHAHVMESDRFATYRIFKQNNNVEPYLYVDVNKYIRNALTRFRCGMSLLAVHANRYKNENVLCTMCQLMHEQNEIHIMFVCPCLHDLREQFIPVKYWRNPSNFRLSILLNSRTKTVLENVAKFLYFSFKRIN